MAASLAARRERFRCNRVPDTIANALRLPFYRQRWPDVCPDRGSLVGLPTFGKTDYIAGFHQFWTPESLRLHDLWTNHSSGTTGPPTHRYRSHTEVAYLERFLAARSSRRSSDVVLTARSAARSHGASIRAATRASVVTLPDEARLSPSVFVDWMLRPHAVGADGRRRRATALVAEQGLIEGASVELARRGWPDHDIRRVTSLGSHARPHVRALVEACWGATYCETFSASEVVGGAGSCPECGWLHPVAHVVFEAVDVASGRDVNEGPAALVMSELFPLSQLQPFVRYRSGDFVEVGPRRCHVDRFAFRYLGRILPPGSPLSAVSTDFRAEMTPMAQRPDGRRPLLRPANLLTSLDQLDGVCRRPPVRCEDDPLGIGTPAVRTDVVAGDQATLVVTVAVTASPQGPSDDLLQASVRQNQPELSEALRAGWARLVVSRVDSVEQVDATIHGSAAATEPAD